MSHLDHHGLLDVIVSSQIYRDYEKAFCEATGLPLAMRSVESWQLPHHGKKNENRFCAMVAAKSRTCAACLQVQQKLAEPSSGGSRTVQCHFGLSDSAVSVKLGDQVIGFLETGQVFPQTPTPAQFERTLKQIGEWGLKLDEPALKEAFFGGKVLPRKKHEAVVRLLEIFAQQLSTISNQIMVRQQNAEPPLIQRAKAFIQQHQSEKLTLEAVARSVNMSVFYFCKMFKKTSGFTFTEYVSRLRIEKAKNLLLNPNLRISEIAYEVGFQSLTHFNRVFKKITGQSPTEYRDKLPATVG